MTFKSEYTAEHHPGPKKTGSTDRANLKIEGENAAKIRTELEKHVQRLWVANPRLFEILRRGASLEAVRDDVYTYLERRERSVFDVDNDDHILEKATVRECVQVFRSIIGPINEHRTDTSALDHLWKLATERYDELEERISIGFLEEFRHLFRGVAGRANIYRENEVVQCGGPGFLKLHGRKAALKRTESLDELAGMVNKYLDKYPSGLRRKVIEWRNDNRRRILEYFNATESDWSDWQWHVKNVIKEPAALFDLIKLPEDQQKSVCKVIESGVPFGVTPYYLSLMDRTASIGYDHAIRAQVIPSSDYSRQMAVHSDNRAIFDFMGESDTSPASLITRRYPLVAILKPFNTCSQICVYCQRNWEIEECLAPDAMASDVMIEQAVSWLEEHRTVGDVLVTGGDPAMMSDEDLDQLLGALAKMKHVYRIRLASRMPVALPHRFTDRFADIVASYNVPGKREIAIVTHFVHPYEVTPEAMAAVQRVVSRGIRVYNQEVFTIENSRRFETCKLRMVLRSIGVDPYYTFNMKGKEETRSYMVPIARLVQERKEEARLLPGLDRTDEPVFNVPRLGKNHLRAMQDRRLVMIQADGTRVYEFHPWEKNITPMPPYNYVDVSIYDYLQELAARGEDPDNYRTLWYYY